MDIFGKYLGEQMKKQASSVSRILEAQAAAAQAVARTRAGVQAAAPVVYTPPPRPSAPAFSSLGQAVARAAAQTAPAAIQAAPPPPTFGQRIAERIVTQAQQATGQARQAFDIPTPQIPMGFSSFAGQDVDEVEPWQTWQSPQGDRVVMPSSYQPPDDWTTMGDPITEPTQIDNARSSRLAYENQPPEVQAQITVPEAPPAPAVRGLDVSGAGRQVLRIGRQAEEQANRNLQQQIDATASAADRSQIDAEVEAERRRDRQSGGLSLADSPFVRVRASRTGQVYTIERSRLGNLGPGDQVLGPAASQPASSRDRGAAGVDVVDNATRIVGDLWSVIQYGGNELLESDTPVGEMMRKVRDEGWGAVVPSYLDLIDTGRVWNANKAIDAYIKLRTGDYDPSEEPVLLDAASLLTGTITEGVQRATGSLGNMTIAPNEDYGITTGGDVTFTQWYESTSTVVYADGTTANVFNGDIERNPDAFEGATIVANDERANAAYTEGIDTDGDGEADVIGADAVRTMYEADLSGVGMFIWQVGMDPLTYIPLTTVGGAKLKNIGRANIARAGTRGEALPGVIQQGVGRVIQRGSQAIDEASSFGAGVFLDKVLTPLTRRIGDLTGLTRESNASRQLSDPAEVGSTGVGIARRMDGSEPRSTRRDTRSAEGGTPTETAAARVQPRQADPSSEPPLDPRTPDGGTLSTTRPPAPRSQPTENLDPGPDLRTPDGGTVATRVADGEGGFVERTVRPEGIIPVSRSAPFPPRPLVTPAGYVDASDVAPRFVDPIRAAARENGVGVTQVAIDSMRASGRFIDQVALGRAIGDAQGVDAATIDHVLSTSDFAAEWNDALRAAGGQPIPFTPSRNMTVTYANAQDVIHLPWGATNAQRTRLYQSGEVVSRLPANPTVDQMAAAERYADLVDAHRFWNPTSVSDPGFQRAMAQASEIRKRLAELDYEGRPTGNVRRGNLLGAGATPQARIGPVTDPSLNGQATDSGFANAAQVRKVLLPGEHEFGEIAGYPVIDQRQGGRNGDLTQTVRIDEDTTVVVRPVREVAVPRALRDQHPDAEPVWARAELLDDAVAPGDVVRIAPTATEAVEQAAAEAQARGLVNGEVPAAAPNGQVDTGIPNRAAVDSTSTPETEPTVTEAPLRVETPNRAEQRRAEVRAIWGEIDPENVSKPLRTAVENGWIRDGTTAHAFQKNVVNVRNWTDRDVEMVLEALNDIRMTRGSVDPLFSAVDVANPATKTWLDDAERLGRVTDAIEIQDSLIRATDVSEDAKKLARAKKKQLEAKRATLRTELGWTDPAKKQAPTRQPSTTEDEAQRRLDRARPADPEGRIASVMERIRPPETVAVRKYVDSLKKVKSLEYGDMPANNLTMDHQGLVRFHGAILTDDEIATLTRHEFSDGDTFLDRWNRYLSQAQGTRGASTLANEDLVSSSLAMAMKDYEELVKTIYKDKKWVEIVKTILKPLTATTQYLREKILGSWLSAPRYIGTQMLGNPVLMSLGGYGDQVARASMYKGVIDAYRETHAMTSLVGGDVFANGNPVLGSDRIANTWGTARAPEVRRHVSSGTDITQDHGVVERFMRRHNMRALARPAAAVFGDTRVIRVGAAFDMVARDTVYTAAFQRQVKEAITDFRLRTTDALMATKMTRARAVGIVDTFRRAYPDGFTSNNVRDFFADYLPDGKAERLARDWQSMVNATNTHARNEVTRVLFAGKETNLDAMLKSVVMFHYFMSRQYFFLIRQALHHPGLINAYAAYQDMMGEYYEAHKDQIPPWLQGYMRFAISGPGVALFVNPTSLLSVGNIFGDAEIDFGEDKTWLQSVLDKGGDWLFISPLVTDALNVLGYMGDDRDVDPLRLMREVEVFNLAVNWGIRTGWINGVDYRFSNPVSDFGNRIRSTVSGVLDGSEAIDFTSTAQREQRQLHGAVVEEAKKAGIDPNTPEGEAQINAILDDPTHPIYRRAMGTYLWGEAIGIGVRITPFLASLRPQTRRMNAAGQDLFDNTTDAERRLINSTDDFRALRSQEQGFYAIGDTRTANVADMIFQDVAYSDNAFFDVTVDGVTYTHAEIDRMSDEERMDLAKAWLSENNLYGIWQKTQDGQDEYLSRPENAEYATFKRWQKEVSDYPGGLEGYWEQAATENESARQYLEFLDANLPPEQREQALRSKFGYMAVRGIPIGWNKSEDGEWYPTSDYRSPEPKPTNGYDPVNIANQPPTPTPYEPYETDYNKNLRKDLDKYQKERARDEVVLQQIYADWGMSPDTRLATVDYDSSKAIKKEFTRRTGGEYITSPSPAVEEYFRWRDENPTGTLDQYIAWNDRQYIRGLPQEFSEEQARPPEGAERDADAYDLWNKTEYRGD